MRANGKPTLIARHESSASRAGSLRKRSRQAEAHRIRRGNTVFPRTRRGGWPGAGRVRDGAGALYRHADAGVGRSDGQGCDQANAGWRGIPQMRLSRNQAAARGDAGNGRGTEPIVGDLKGPWIIKPSHLGSSIGVAKVVTLEELAEVLPAIFKYDTSAILEPFVENMVEYNVAVSRMSGDLVTSAIERPKRTDELLNFKEKYLSGGGQEDGEQERHQAAGRAGE